MTIEGAFSQLIVKTNSNPKFDKRKEQRNGHSAKVIVRQNSQKWPFGG